MTKPQNSKTTTPAREQESWIWLLFLSIYGLACLIYVFLFFQVDSKMSYFYQTLTAFRTYFICLYLLNALSLLLNLLPPLEREGMPIPSLTLPLKGRETLS